MSKWIRLYSDEDFTTGAGLPASGTILGARHYNTTNSTWYSWNGSAWEAEGGGSGGHTITEGDAPLTARANLDFDATAFNVADDVANDATDVTLNFGTGAGQPAAGDHNHDAAYAPIAHVNSTDGHPVAVGASPGPETAGLMSGPDKTKLDGVEAGAVAAGATGDAHAAIVTGNPHGSTAADVGADPAGTAATAVSTHEAASPAHAGSAVSYDPTGTALTATNVQAAITELDTGKAASRSRGIAVVNAGGIAADTLIATATNCTGTLLNYHALTFADQVEVYINGQLMRNAASGATNYDVYQSDVQAEREAGSFYCEFPLSEGDVIQMFAGGAGTQGGGVGDVTSDGTTSQDAVLFAERADHVNTPAAGSGEAWVRNATPSLPMFTDDAGRDHVLSRAGGLGYWNLFSITDGIPTDGQVSVDSQFAGVATNIRIGEAPLYGTAQSDGVSGILGNLETGSILVLSRPGIGGVWLAWRVGAPTPGVGYQTFPIEALVGGTDPLVLGETYEISVFANLLVNDAIAPGNSKYYGTNGSGTKGYYDLPVGGGGSLYLQSRHNMESYASTSWFSYAPDDGLFGNGWAELVGATDVASAVTGITNDARWTGVLIPPTATGGTVQRIYVEVLHMDLQNPGPDPTTPPSNATVGVFAVKKALNGAATNLTTGGSTTITLVDSSMHWYGAEVPLASTSLSPGDSFGVAVGAVSLNGGGANPYRVRVTYEWTITG